MLELKSYSKEEMVAMFKTKNNQGLARKLYRYGVSFDVQGRGENAIFTITNIDNPFKIYCIEDLILFSNNVNNGNNYSGKFVTLENDLNFNSFLSYNDYSTIVDETAGMTLIESMTSNTGFTPMSTPDKKCEGTFDGKNHKIYNL